LWPLGRRALPFIFKGKFHFQWVVGQSPTAQRSRSKRHGFATPPFPTGTPGPHLKPKPSLFKGKFHFQWVVGLCPTALGPQRKTKTRTSMRKESDALRTNSVRSEHLNPQSPILQHSPRSVTVPEREIPTIEHHKLAIAGARAWINNKTTLMNRKIIEKKKREEPIGLTICYSIRNTKKKYPNSTRKNLIRFGCASIETNEPHFDRNGPARCCI
jgi:hypothetical protein